MKKSGLWVVLLAASISQAIVFAQEIESPNAEMDRLITAGEYEEAYLLARASLEEWEGDPQFDFLYGLAALESGEANESVFAFERTAATTNDRVLRGRARLELARAYFLTNNLTASENLFNEVLATNPPANVQQNIQAFLQLIDARRETQAPTWTGTISSVIGSDDNINSATSNSLIDTPLIGEIELDPNGQETDDSFMNTTLRVAYNYPFTRNRSIGANVSLVHLDNFSTDQFDIDSLRGAVNYNWGNQVNRFRHGISFTQVNLDGDGFQDSTALNSSWQRAGDSGWYQSLSASYSQIRYDTSNGRPSSDLRDVNQILFTAGLTNISGPATHTFNLYHADEDPENPNGGKHNGRNFTGLAYSFLYRVTGEHTAFVRATLQDVEHDSEHPVFFNTTRNDDQESITTGWFWQIQRSLTITAEATYTDNSSNIPLFDYSRFKYQAGIRYQF